MQEKKVKCSVDSASPRMGLIGKHLAIRQGVDSQIPRYKLLREHSAECALLLKGFDDFLF